MLYIASGIEDLEDAELLLAIINDSKLNRKACSDSDMVEATLPLLTSRACTLGSDGEVNLSLLPELLLQALHSLGTLLAIDGNTT